jgi:tRNA (guanine-N7-)-methyltransferase
MDQASRIRRPRLVETKTLPKPTAYVVALTGQFSEWAYDEVRAKEHRGSWRATYGKSASEPLDLEIGTGNGYFFAHRAVSAPDRSLIGMEVKYKPLIQSIRRARNDGAENARIVRYDASCLEDIFATEELNHVFIHHPDPWPRQRDWKHRLIQDEFLKILWSLMRPGSFINFKTDSEDYYDWALPIFEKSQFKKLRATRDLHKSEWAKDNFITHFESLFLQKGQPIFYCRFEKPLNTEI